MRDLNVEVFLLYYEFDQYHSMQPYSHALLLCLFFLSCNEDSPQGEGSKSMTGNTKSRYDLDNWLFCDSEIILMEVSKEKQKEAFQLNLLQGNELTKLNRSKTIEMLQKN